MKKITQEAIMKTLDWAYGAAVAGGAGLDSASDMANDYMPKSDSESLRDRVDSLIRWQNLKSGTTGFLTGLGGLLTLPIAIPANISVVLFVQVRMVAAIALMGGYDVKDDRVKALVYACMAGNSAKDILKNAGIVFGQKMAESAIKNISGKTIVAINQKVGFRLLTKFGEKGIVNLGKAVPLIGGVIGAAFDSVATNAVGNIARDTFIPLETAAGQEEVEA
ncbi:EcsC family protein [Microbulbifer taiwanensis]|nr:EcsC family protein [Microbulbifer taiwanensis]